MLKFGFVSVAFSFLCSLSAFAQLDIRTDSEKLNLVSFNYGFYAPAGDLSERFGENSSIGIMIGRKTRSNYLFAVEGNFLFGRTVYEPGLLQNLLSENDEIFDEQSRVAELLIQERGFILNATVGKIIPFSFLNPNSGLLLKGGVGFMQHKIRIEHQNNRIPQLEGEYLKGYDRMTNGVSLNQFVGFINFSNNRLTNFYVGLDIHEGFTSGRRTWNFDTQTPGTDKRLDILVGLKAGWCLLLYKRMATDYYMR